MYSHLDKYQLVLASNSPRRQQLLADMGVDFSVKSSKGEETYPPEIAVEKVAEFLAVQKADWFGDFSANELYITSDTTVVLEGKVLGKPKNATEATKMLGALSGKEHDVITGYCLKSQKKQVSDACITHVKFRSLTDLEINYYVHNFKPFDKAGSYGIQEWIGMIGISEIKGSYFNVMGLPTHEIFRELMLF